MPVLPEVPSTIVPPGLSRPLRSASSIIATPMRSLTEPPGFMNSAFAYIFGLRPLARGVVRIRGGCGPPALGAGPRPAHARAPPAGAHALDELLGLDAVGADAVERGQRAVE